MRALIFCCLATMIWAPCASAENCASATTQLQLNQCAADQAKQSDAALNAAYATIRKRLKDDPAATKLLVTAQRAWIGFRDSECAFSSSATVGGSMNGMVNAECLDALTRKRLVELNAYLHCQEGDTTCPVPPQ
jgi:uncharacterized protein YecT (DUF1311 family)